MRLLDHFLALTKRLEFAFVQERTALRIRRLMLSCLLTVGRHWISRMISTAGRDQQDWSADYRVFSRSPWKPQDLFDPAVRYSIEISDDEYVAIALDDTKLARPGRKVAAAVWQADPLSPPFHVNLMRGLRFLHFSALLPLHRKENAPCRGLPVAFEMVQVAKKPGKKATAEQWSAYQEERKRNNLSTLTVKYIQELRGVYDRAGGAAKTLIMVGDGSFCNRTVFSGVFDRTVLITRARKDARLCKPAAPGGRRIYDAATFTPESLRQNDDLAWTTLSIHHGGKFREVRYKEMTEVLWPGGARRQRLRLIILAPTPYRLTKEGRLLYRDAAYLLTPDLKVPVATLLQAYCDRWQIEVNHRDLKDTLGMGDAQVWATRSVPRQPSFVAATYSLLLLAGLMAYGPQRTADYEPLPKWRRHATRPSCLDLVTQLRKEALACPDQLRAVGICVDNHAMIRKAAG